MHIFIKDSSNKLLSSGTLENGQKIVEGLSVGQYMIDLYHTSDLNDENNQYIYFHGKNPTNLSDRKQTVEILSNDNLKVIPLNWKKMWNPTCSQNWEKILSTIQYNNQHNVSFNYSFMIEDTTISTIGSTACGYIFNNETFITGPYNGHFYLYDMEIKKVTVHQIATSLEIYNKTNGAALGFNNEVIFAACGFPRHMAHNYINSQTRQFGPDYSSINVDHFHGAVTLPNGSVLIIPFNRNEFAIVDPITLTVTKTLTAPDTGTGKYWGGVLLPNGKVVIIPYNAQQFLIFDYKLNTFTKVGTADPTPEKFSGGVLLPNGSIATIPYNVDYIDIFNPITMTYFKKNNVTTTTNAYRSALLLPDGKVLYAPYNDSYFSVYDPTTNAFNSINAIGANTAERKYTCMFMDMNGELIVCGDQVPAIRLGRDHNSDERIFSLDERRSSFLKCN